MSRDLVIRTRDTQITIYDCCASSTLASIISSECFTGRIEYDRETESIVEFWAKVDFYDCIQELKRQINRDELEISILEKTNVCDSEVLSEQVTRLYELKTDVAELNWSIAQLQLFTEINAITPLELMIS